MVKLGKMFKKMLNNKNVLKVLLLVCVVVILMLMVRVLHHQHLHHYGQYEFFTTSASNLDSTLKDKKKACFIYADWCGHCKKFKPVWDEVASGVNTDNDQKMIKVDLGQQNSKSEELMNKYNVSGFPTVVLVDNTQSHEVLEVYEGERTKTSLTRYVNSKM